MNKILIICGATASGKTNLAIECAKLLESEVISADSMNVYKNLNIGTAKPNLSEMQGIKHHLIDVVEENESFSVSDYRELALPIIYDLQSKNKVPVICGGTGFYINSILYKMSYGEAICNELSREKYYNLASQYGNEYVFNILKEKDIESANKLHFNDLKRVIRALEIYESGKKKSEIVDKLEPIFDYRAYSFDYDRQVLYYRINKRVDVMIANGLVDEVKGLIDRGITLDNQCMQGIGYKEIYDYFIGNCTLQDAIEQIKLNSRHYAKRQITFFKKLPNLIMIKTGDNKEIAKQIVSDLLK